LHNGSQNRVSGEGNRLTDAAPGRHAGVRFVLTAGAWSLALFGVLKLAVVEQQLLVPLIGLQRNLAIWGGGAPRAPIYVTLACSAADVIALAVGATLAFPVAWRRRLLGATGGIVVILVLNTLRIATLGRVAGTALFAPLHVHVWPAILLLATVGYVGAWMWLAGPRRTRGPGGPAPLRRFAVAAFAGVGLYAALAPWFLTSRLLWDASAWMAHGAVAVLGAFGVEATATAIMLATRQGAYMVTPECLVTPVMAVYLAGVLTWPTSWGRRALALLAFGPLFAGLALARLLTVALPPLLLDSPLVLTHAFYQLLLASLAVGLAAAWRDGGTWQGSTARRALGAGLAGLGLIIVAGGTYGRAMATATGALGVATPPDPQGALALLPQYQIGLFVALWLAALGLSGGRRLALGIVLLGASQVALLALLGELSVRADLVPPVTLVRAWAVALPALVLWGLTRRGATGAALLAGPPVQHAQ